jgi:hypothetical protein
MTEYTHRAWAQFAVMPELWALSRSEKHDGSLEHSR